MKWIVAIIKPFRIDAVKEALDEIGIGGMTVTEVRGHGHQEGPAGLYRGAETSVDFLPKLMLEVALPDALAARCMEVIVRTARTGKPGDGRVLVLPLEQVTRVRTGETGEVAL